MTSETDVRRIAFVTRRFGDLKGFQRMGNAVYVMAAMWLGVRAAGDPVSWWSVAALVWLLLAGEFMRHTASAFYANRFGRTADIQWRWGVFYCVVVGPAVWFDTHRGGPSMAALLLAGVALSEVVRDWPWRSYRLLDALACVSASLLWARVPRTEVVFFSALGLMCASAVVTGYLDHRLLVHVVGPGRLNADDAELPNAS